MSGWIPDLQTVPDCSRCDRKVISAEIGWRCDNCRLVWDQGGANGRKDARTPLDRLRDAHESHGLMDISTAEFSDRVSEFLEEAMPVQDTVYDIATTELSVLRDVVEQAAPGYVGHVDGVIKRLREVSW